jgi:hypothetical protein
LYKTRQTTDHLVQTDQIRQFFQGWNLNFDFYYLKIISCWYDCLNIISNVKVVLFSMINYFINDNSLTCIPSKLYFDSIIYSNRLLKNQ